MTQDGNQGKIEYVHRRLRGSGDSYSMMVKFSREIVIEPIAESVASYLTQRFGTQVNVDRFVPNTRPKGDYAKYPLKFQGRLDLHAIVQCSGKTSDWANLDFNMVGYNPMNLLNQYARRSLKKVGNDRQ